MAVDESAANESCVGPSSEGAGKASSCEGCPNQQACAAGAGRAVDPDLEVIAQRLAGVKRKLLVLSGKGGVGKSTMTAQLGFALAARGLRVGLLDVDICGPSLPQMLGLRGQSVHRAASGWSPVYVNHPDDAAAADVELGVMSVGFMTPSDDAALIWRGPRKNGLIRQFLTDVDWGELDYLLVDTPPGTSDEHISLVQLLGATLGPHDGAIVVSTPQEVALLDVRKELSFCAKTQLRVLGVVENMSGLAVPLRSLTLRDADGADATGPALALLAERCPELLELSAHVDVFPAARGGAEAMAASFGVPFLGRVPIEPALTRACEAGPSREHFEGIGLLLRHGLPLESSWLSRAPFEGHEWLAAVTDLNRLYTGDTNIPGTVDGRYCVRGSTCSEYVKFAFDTDDSRNVVLKFFEAREPWELEARVLVGLSRIFERGQTHSDGEGGGDSLHAAPRLLERIDLSGPRSFTPLPYVLVLEEGNRAPLVATQDSELERVAVVSRLLRCVRLLHEAVELEDDLYAPTPRSVERAAASETDEAAGRSIAVHCDLKPSHFLRVGRHYGWRLIDFGSVRREGAEVRSLEYTRAYCAPEVAEAEASGRPLVVTRAIDVWALGLIVYEIFAAEPLLRGCFSPRAQREGATGAAADEAVHAESLPFSNEEWKEYVAWLASGGAAAMIAKLEANEKQLPEALLHMLRRMLKKAPEQRPTLADLLRLSYLKPGVATVKRQQKTLLGLFCCPSKGRQRLDLERDMRTVLRALPVGEREIRAAAQFPTDLLGPLRGDARNEPIRPRVLHFSCHGTPDGRLLMEDSEGRAFTVSTRELVCTLEECLQLQDGIECIFLNLCSSHHIGEDIHAGFPHLYVVAWRTVVQDRVAQAFAREFYTYLGVESSKGNRGSVAEAYAAAERDFHAKYREGDPTVYDEAGNRTGKKDSSVHGVPMLLRPVGWS